MSKHLFYLGCAFLGFTFPSIAFCQEMDEAKVLRELDKVISQKAIFQQQKERELSKMKRRLYATVNDNVRSQLCNDLFVQYLHYQADSALAYVERKWNYLSPSEKVRRESEIKMNRAEVYGVMGLYGEAFTLLDEIDQCQLSEDMLRYYYSTFRAYYGWVADYTPNSQEKKDFMLKTQAYRDSILQSMDRNMDAEIVRAEKILMDGQPDEALKALNKLLDRQPMSQQKAYIYYTLAETYEVLHEVKKQIFCLAMTAISDLQKATREYASLQKLAYLMYGEGDLDRAYKYLNCSMEDAVNCNARLRSFEVAQFFPIIDKAYKEKERKNLRFSRILLTCVSVLSIFLIIAVFYLYRWNKKINTTRRDLRRINKQLQLVNKELAETGKIKEMYIGRYLDRCVSYLDKLEAYRRSLARLAMSSHVEELYKAIKSEQFIHDERKAFYQEFDKSFLELFPDFITSFNALLQPAYQIVPKSNELLTTELRVFALIRLGISDSNSIAHFLNYSLATIYNYRSRIRNKAIHPEKFEESLKNL